MRKLISRNDIILIASILIASLLIFVIIRSLHEPGEKVVIYVDGETVCTYSLSDEVKVKIDGYNGGRNELRISGRTAYMTDASCPDKLCVHQGKADRVGESIVCLPNRVVVSIEGKDESGYDAVTR